MPQVNSVPSLLATSKLLKEQAEAEEKKCRKEAQDAARLLKSTIILSGVVVAVYGVIFAVKRLRKA